MKKNSMILGMMAMAAALDPTFPHSPETRSKREHGIERMDQIQKWAKAKVDADKVKMALAKLRRLDNPKKKTKKHVFNVQYLRGKEPVFS